LEPSGFDDGPYWQLKLKPSANHLGVLVYKGDSTKGEEKAAGEPGRGWGGGGQTRSCSVTHPASNRLCNALLT
jgi:hypothetical protein